MLSSENNAGVALFVTTGAGVATMGSCLRLLSNAVKFLSASKYFAVLSNSDEQPDLFSLQQPGFMDELRWNEEYLNEIVDKVGQHDGNSIQEQGSGKGIELAQRTASQLVCAVKAMRKYERRGHSAAKEQDVALRAEAEAKAMKALKIIRQRMLSALQIVQLDNQDNMWKFMKDRLGGNKKG